MSTDHGIEVPILSRDLTLVEDRRADLGVAARPAGGHSDHLGGGIRQHNRAARPNTRNRGQTGASRTDSQIEDRIALADARRIEQRLGCQREMVIDEFGAFLPSPRDAIPHL